MGRKPFPPRDPDAFVGRFIFFPMFSVRPTHPVSSGLFFLRWIFVFGVSCTTGFTGLSLRAQTPEGQGLGLRPPTEEERGWMDQNMQQTKAVRLNALGLERINTDRR